MCWIVFVYDFKVLYYDLKFKFFDFKWSVVYVKFYEKFNKLIMLKEFKELGVFGGLLDKM